ncbi:hypothetical protein D0T50_05265 [Bacteroides sp. 214]|uniref:hypothetical protein n=1 Tax=Bacteroides sp. 214 TaxID=2302935 RepID=UPI0013D8B7E7|nr:hypothetical protein [Bacteroides sp. 214]NDW12298.1 hypothetical protein [Bacteroides sp. 214]
MKIRRLKLLMMLPMLVLGMVACDDNDEKDPQKVILGKWEIFAIGDWPNVNEVAAPRYYKEYFSDGTVGLYYYESKEYEMKGYKYSFDSKKSFLYYHWFLDGEEINAIQYSYKFYDDKLRIKHINQGLHGITTHIYKRIK